MKKLSIVVCIAFLVVSCHSEMDNNRAALGYNAKEMSGMENDEGLEMNYQEEYSPPYSESKSNNSRDSDFKKAGKIIKEGNMKIEVEDIFSAKKVIDILVQRHDAYYEKEILKNSNSRAVYSLKIRLPSSKFNILITDLEKGQGTILEKNINAKDVTEEFLDLEIRLKNNKSYLKRYNELLVQANTIEEMIEIQEKIRQIELMVDSNKGRIKYLGDRVRYSTLSIEMAEKPEEIIADAPTTFGDNIASGFNNGMLGIRMFILFIVNIWPVFVVLFLVWMIRKRWYLHMFKRMQELR